MGADSIPDFLCISFSATDYVGHQFGPNAVETEDTYIRLDRDIADLLTFLDNRIGQGAYLLFMTADHACMENPKFMLDHKLAAGFSDPITIKDTIRYFFTREYGKPEYLQCYLNDQVHLDETLIQKDNLDVCSLETDLGHFLRKSIPGIIDIITACNLQEKNTLNSFRNRIQRGYQKGRSGNVCIQFAPDGPILCTAEMEHKEQHMEVLIPDAHVPLLWYGWRIPAGNSADEVQITDIAPTLSFLLNITLPNGCTEKN